MAGFAWVTLATNDSYSLGALVLANSLRQVGTPHQLAVLVTPGVTNAMREQLRSIFNLVVEVNILDSKDEANLRLLQRPELGVTFTKLHCWRLTQYEKCVFLDADTLVLQNADELFERDELSAAPDVGWPDCFNSGVFVYRPSNETYENLVKFALERGSFDGGDQGLLNSYFSDWAHKDISKHLPFIYNMCSTACYSYLPAFKEFGSGVKIVHFIGPAKPWLQYFDTESREVQPSPDLQHLRPVLQRWWDTFFSFIQPNLSNEMARSKSPAVHNPQPYPQPFYTSIPPTVVTYDEPKAHFDYTITVNESGPSSDYKNVWDPWDEYEQNTEQIEHSSSQLVAEPITITGLPESHNTNAHSVVDVTTFEQPNLTSPIPDLTPPTPTPPSIQFTIPTYHPPSEPQTNNSYVEVVETKPTTPPPPLSPQPPMEIIYFQNQYSFTNNSPVEVPVTFPEHVPSNHQNHAQPHEFEPPCTVANESTLHPNGTGSHDHEEDAGLAAAFSQLKLGEPRSPGQLALEDHLRRQGWEVGNIDYLGRDSFENIWKKICETIDAVPKPTEPTPPPVAQTPEVPPTVVTQTEPEPVTKESPESQTQEQSATAQPEIKESPTTPAPAEVSAATAPAEVPPAVAAPTELPPAAAPPAAAPVEVPSAVVAPVEVPAVAAPAEAPPAAAPPALAEIPPAPAEVPSAAAPPAPAEVPPAVAPPAPAEVPPAAAAPAPAEVLPAAVPAEAPAAPAEVSPATAPAVESPAEAPPAAPVAAPAVELAAAPVVEPPVATAPAEVPPSAAPTVEPPAATAPVEVPPAAAPVPPPAAPAVEPPPAATAPVEVPPAAAPADVPPPASAPAELPPAEVPVAAVPSEVAPTEAPPAPVEIPPATVPTELPAAPKVVQTPVETQPQAPPAVPAEPQSTTVPAAPVEAPAAPQPASPAAEAVAAPVAPQEAAKSQQKVKGESTKKTEPKSAASPSEAAGPTPPPRKAGSSPKKTKAKK